MDAETGNEAIRVAGLKHWFGSGEARKQVLHDIDLTVNRGEFVILLGASGSGKTTLLTLIGCLRQVEEGSVRLLGRELNGADEPTAALDRESGHTVVEMLRNLGRERGTTTLMVTHDPRIIEMADRIVRMEDGRIVEEGPPRPGLA